MHKTCVPGPGTYKFNNLTIGNDGLKFTLKPKLCKFNQNKKSTRIKCLVQIVIS